MFDLCLYNANIVTEHALTCGELYTADGKIAAITAPGANLPTRERVDVAGRLLLPGVVDPHLHGGHGDPDRETFSDVGHAAAAGGVTTVMDQPLSSPSTVDLDSYLAKKQEADAAFVVDYALWGGLVPGRADCMQVLAREGAVAFKSFMCRCSNFAWSNDGVIIDGLREMLGFGGLHAVHAENDAMIAELAARFAAEGRDDIDSYLDSHPPYSELEAILRYIFLLRQVPGSRGHIVHCSIPQGVEAVCRARLDGVDITAETCPQYLALCTDDLHELGGVAKCDPPVRERGLVEELWRCVLEGKIDMIASDHSPHPFEKKVVPPAEFSRASEGVTGMQTSLPVMLTEGVHRRGMPLTDLVRLMSANTARRFGVYGRKGDLVVGFDADMIVVDPDREWVCRAEDMLYRNRHTPYAGRTMHGHVDETYVRGVPVYRDGKVLVPDGFGEYVPKQGIFPAGSPA